MSGRRVAARGLGSAAAIAALIVFVPRAAALNEDALTCSLAAAALSVVAALLCLLGRVWSGIAATLAAV
ncbi:MAG: hypothetical protein ABI862_15405, partial [Ilumatobacteraceae bacterium]